MNIERLRALERYCLEQAEMMAPMIKSGAVDEGYGIGAGNAYKVCAQRIATLIAELGQEVGAVAWTKDAEAYGNALNEAAWKFVEECPEKSALLFNNTKKPLRAAILTYAEHVARATSPAHTSEAMDAVAEEVARAVRKFPTWPTDPLHAVAVLGEEFGELTKAVLQSVYEPHKVKPDEVRMEAVQTAAMAMRFLQSIDAYVYSRSEQHSQDAAMRQEAE